MFRTIEDFRTAWDYEAEMTGKALLNLTDVSLGQRVTEDGRTLGFIGWHLAVTLREMLGKVGLTIDAPAEDAECPTSAAEIARLYGIGGKSVGDEVSNNWTAETLLRQAGLRVPGIYGPAKEEWAAFGAPAAP